MRFEESTTVKAPAEKVFDYVSDFMRHGEWAGHGLTVTGDGPAAVGAVFSTEAKQFGTQREKSTITEVKQNASFVWESEGALGRVRHWFGVSGDGGQTTLSKGLEMVQPKFLAKMMSWKIKRDSPKSLRNDLEKIKAKLEGSVS